ncbi:hypothetical protein V8G54_027263 [Vigna mungo]|uniref:Uncharacterized protein n=1 Tax=Vigna mungo TaxID=3915 RepID=A0AAQ3RMW9_VIGMU
MSPPDPNQHPSPTGGKIVQTIDLPFKLNQSQSTKSIIVNGVRLCKVQTDQPQPDVAGHTTTPTGCNPSLPPMVGLLVQPPSSPHTRTLTRRNRPQNIAAWSWDQTPKM